MANLLRSLWSSSNSMYGFTRSEMNSKDLLASVKYYHTHFFIGFGVDTDQKWPARIESEGLGKQWEEALSTLAADQSKGVRINAFDGPLGQVLIFPHRHRYDLSPDESKDTLVSILRAHLPVADNSNNNSSNNVPVHQELADDYIFVCAHNARDRRCGECGPILADAFKKEIAKQQQQQQLSRPIQVHKCSHVGGHEYAGNVLAFVPRLLNPNNANEQKQEQPQQQLPQTVMGDWYGYVTPDDVPNLLTCIRTGCLLVNKWRGVMGFNQESIKAMAASAPACENCDCGRKV